MGHLLVVVVHVANVHDTVAGDKVLRKALESHPTLKSTRVDAGYRKMLVVTMFEFGLKIDISDRTKPNKWQTPPKCRRVEYTFGWMSHSRRFSRDYEIRALSAAAIVILSHISVLLEHS